MKCPKCGSEDTDYEILNKYMDKRYREWFCGCGNEWTEHIDSGLIEGGER